VRTGIARLWRRHGGAAYQPVSSAWPYLAMQPSSASAWRSIFSLNHVLANGFSLSSALSENIQLLALMAYTCGVMA